MDIDLGEELVFNVKIGGSSYKLKEPTFKDVRQMQDKDGKEDDAFIDLLVNLGMPKDVAENMGLAKLKKLSDGLMAPFNEKK